MNSSLATHSYFSLFRLFRLSPEDLSPEELAAARAAEVREKKAVGP